MLFFLYLFLLLLFLIALSKHNVSELYYLIFSNVVFHAGFIIFYFLLHNLYFSFFSGFFLTLFTFFNIMHIKKQKKDYVLLFPVFVFQIIFLGHLFFQFFQCF